MRKLFILSPFLIMIIIIAGCKGATSGPKDCGTNYDCFIEASKTCKPAKLTNTVTVNIFGILQTTTSSAEIKGPENGKCIYYIRNEKNDVKFSGELVQQMLAAGATKEQIQQQEQESNKLLDKVEGFDGTCRFNTADLTAMLTRWKAGNFSTDDWEGADCTGKMFEQTSAEITSAEITKGQPEESINDEESTDEILGSPRAKLLVNGKETSDVPKSSNVQLSIELAYAYAPKVNFSISKVNFYYLQSPSNILLGSDEAAPYSITWDTSQKAVGEHTVYVLAEISGGVTGTIRLGEYRVSIS